MFDGPMTESLLGRATARGLVDLKIHNLRDWSDDRHKKVDDRPYGGGPGMVIQAEPISNALKSIRAAGAKVFKKQKPFVLFMSPQGKVLTQTSAQRLSQKPWVVLLCGHYEGIDERAMAFVDEEISIGDYVLTGGEIPAMVVADTVLRLVPGVVKEAGSLQEESFQNGSLDYPHYTRPAVWNGKKVPDILRSGDHAAISAWRKRQADAVTKKKRPDLVRAAIRRKS